MPMPGGRKNHQAPVATAPESFARSSIVPHDGLVGSPRPTNASVDSARMVAETISTVLANTSGSTFGRMCLRTIQRGDAPSAFARSMNWRSFTDSTWLRTIRDVPAHDRMPITMISSVTRPPGQSSATRPSAGRDDDRERQERDHEEPVVDRRQHLVDRPP